MGIIRIYRRVPLTNARERFLVREVVTTSISPLYQAKSFVLTHT